MEKNTTKNIIIILIGVVIALAVIYGAVAYTKYEKTEPVSAEAENGAVEEENENEAQEEEPEEEEPEEDEAAEPEKEITKYSGGTYLIGEDIPSGEYVIEPNFPEGSFEITSDLSGEPESLIAGGTYNVRTYVTVSDGQYLKFDGAAFPIEEAEAHIPKDGVYRCEGMYLVGFDIQPGDYSAAPETEGFIEIREDSTWSEDSVIQSIPVSEESEISLEDDTYVRLSGVNLTEIS